MPDPQLVKQAFGRIARRYDLLNTLLSLGLHKAWRRRAVALCGDGERALDVCSGTGDLSRRLARRFRRVVGVDFSRPMLEVARRRGGADLVEGDALALPFANDAFDCAITGFSLRNLADLERLFAEMARVVRPGGRVVSLELTRPPGRVLRRLHDLYLRWVVPGAGSMVDGAAYRHLAQTIRGFPEPEAVAGIMAHAGLREVRIQRLSGGIATIHAARAPE
jgi:demethylmenaquinone methyltransferase/2-methoxy-6-polyprenyl-1,4-benzoquinol methylase